MSNECPLLQCYNRGCGQKYDPNQNKKDSCRHHPGNPVFHDAYKGWDCCNKKCTDFTEFLNIKGCTLSEHSNVKPLEPEKPIRQNIPDKSTCEIIPTPAVIQHVERPSIDTPLCAIKPTIAPSLEQLIKDIPQQEKQVDDSDEISLGAMCTNRGCNATFQKTHTICIYHPGVPIFHEGLKYWSCCQRKTSDFNSFLNQVGCEKGNHIWKKNEVDKDIQCRWDFHQTPSHVFVSIYAKHYCPRSSRIELNPVRLYSKLIFPQQSDGSFILDIELRGIINVEQSEVTMLGTKVEIKMKKAHPGSWLKLGEPIANFQDKKEVQMEKVTTEVEAVNLDDL